MKCEYWARTPWDVYRNVVLIVSELGSKSVPESYWRNKVLKFCQENEGSVGLCELLVM